MHDSTPRSTIATRNFAATETTDFADSERLLRVIGEVEAASGAQARLVEAVPQGTDPRRLLLDLRFQESGALPAEKRWTAVKVFEKWMNERRQFLNVDIRWGNDIVESLDVTEVIA
jgi:hypothetical protein